ncbi:hypothetical protein [Xanthomonas phage R3-22-T1]|nr:hypothetical protein [Xanthomonas phage R3-22-T1]
MSECIEHQGYLMPNGYGQVNRDSKVWLAHRWAAHVAHGPCPEGQVVRHTCDNRKCVNPEHLIYGTQGDNLIDRRERHRYRKLTREDVEHIRATPGTLKSVAELYGVSLQMIHNIRTGKQWRPL